MCHSLLPAGSKCRTTTECKQRQLGGPIVFSCGYTMMDFPYFAPRFSSVCCEMDPPPCYPSQEEGEMATVCGPVVATPARLPGGLWTCVRERGSKNKVPQHTLSLPPPTAFFIHAFWPSSSLWFLLQVLPHAIIILFKKNSFFLFCFHHRCLQIFQFRELPRLFVKLFQVPWLSQGACLFLSPAGLNRARVFPFCWRGEWVHAPCTSVVQGLSKFSRFRKPSCTVIACTSKIFFPLPIWDARFENFTSALCFDDWCFFNCMSSAQCGIRIGS